MKHILFRFIAAFTAAKVAFLHPRLMVSAHFRVMASMYENILKVQETEKPFMFQVGIVLPENERHAIATVWVGAGVKSSPVERIIELGEANKKLKEQIFELTRILNAYRESEQ